MEQGNGKTITRIKLYIYKKKNCASTEPPAVDDLILWVQLDSTRRKCACAFSPESFMVKWLNLTYVQVKKIYWGDKGFGRQRLRAKREWHLQDGAKEAWSAIRRWLFYRSTSYLPYSVVGGNSDRIILHKSKRTTEVSQVHRGKLRAKRGTQPEVQDICAKSFEQEQRLC